MHLFLQLEVLQNVPVHIHPVPHRRFQYRDTFNEMCKTYPSGVLYAELWQKGCFQSVDAIQWNSPEKIMYFPNIYISNTEQLKRSFRQIIRFFKRIQGVFAISS